MHQLLLGLPQSQFRQSTAMGVCLRMIYLVIGLEECVGWRPLDSYLILVCS